MIHLILVATGDDRPGVLDEITRFVFDHGGNLKQSRTINLMGTFCLLLYVEADDKAAEALHQGLPDFARALGVRLQLRFPRGGLEQTRPYRLIASGRDQPGLLNKISHLMRVLGINIDDVQSDHRVHPVTGAAFFEMRLLLAVPEQVPLMKLREYLEHLCGELQLDWELSRA
jgi:glycine cleavage system transcriptional repressor